MPIDIPEYVAKTELNTERKSMPQPVVKSGMGEGLEKLGDALTDLGARMMVNQSNKNATAANNAATDLESAAREEAVQVIKDAPASGEGMHDSMTGWIDEKAGEIKNSDTYRRLTPEQKASFDTKVRDLRSRYSVSMSENEYNQNRGF